MANPILWDENPAAETIIAVSGALKNLANGGNAVSAEVANGTGKYRWASFELYIHDFAAAPTAGTVFELHICYQLDGTNYADGEDGDLADPNLSGNTLHGAFIVPVATDEDMRMQVVGVPLMPHDFKCCIVNRSGQGIANTDGSFLKIYRYSEEVQ
jgi:hypothetical protein